MKMIFRMTYLIGCIFYLNACSFAQNDAAIESNELKVGQNDFETDLNGTNQIETYPLESARLGRIARDGEIVGDNREDKFSQWNYSNLKANDLQEI